jgi:hypothetical protein
VRPLGLLIAFLREVGGTLDDERKHEREFLRRLNDDGYEDFRDAVVAEWFAIKYSTAFVAAHPPTTKELMRRNKQTKPSGLADFRAALIKGFLKLTMPNGKKLGDCTGQDCINFGGLFQKIGEHVPLNRRVGDVLSEEQIKNLLTIKRRVK